MRWIAIALFVYASVIFLIFIFIAKGSPAVTNQQPEVQVCECPSPQAIAQEAIAWEQVDPRQEALELTALINAYRVDNGLSALSLSLTLTDVAAWMSQDMAEKDYFSHTDSLGRDPFQRMADFGYNYNAWKGEILARGSDTPELTLELWKASKEHNDVMLNPNFTTVGAAEALVPDYDYRWYWAVEFGGY